MPTRMREILWRMVVLDFVSMTSAILCYHCDSIALEDCAMTLNELDTLPYVSCPADLTCVASIVDSITYRGCGQDTPTLGATYKKTCSENLCNKGVYPPGRLKCHHCQGAECVEKRLGKPRPCLYHQEEDQCYTDVVSATAVYRGCASDTNHSISRDAEYCEINGCNNKVGASLRNCVQCDSDEGRGCKMDLFFVQSTNCNIMLYNTCTVVSLLTQRESCFTYHKENRVVRGCTSEMTDDIRADVANVEECNDHDYCNKRCIRRQGCLSCDSNSTENCRSNATQLAASTCGSAEASSCYACEHDDWSVKRGCGKPPLRADTTRCYECDKDDGCNSMSFSRCYQCNSEQGASCATWDRPGNIFIDECQLPASPCLAIQFQNGSVVRGCMDDKLNCAMDGIENCISCDGNFCNKGSFPRGRLWCHQCVGGDMCELIADDPTPCAINSTEPFDSMSSCLEFYDENNDQLIRGCRSNGSLYYECMLRNVGGCHLCYTNGCNNSPKDNLQSSAMLELDSIAFQTEKSSCNVVVVWKLFLFITLLILFGI